MSVALMTHVVLSQAVGEKSQEIPRQGRDGYKAKAALWRQGGP